MASTRAQLPLALLLKNQKVKKMETILYPGNGVAGGTAAATRTKIPLVPVYQDLNCRLTGVADVTAGGGADGTLAPEQPGSLIRQMMIEGSSSARPKIGEIKKADSMAYFRLQHFLKGVQGEFIPLAIPGVQAATAFAIDFEIDFELARTQDPRMTWLNARELSSLDLVIDWGLANDLIVGGTRVTTLTNTKVTVVSREFHDPAAFLETYGINRLSEREIPITAAAADLLFELKRGYLVRGFLVKTFTQAGTVHTPVDTVINSVTLELNREPKLFHPWKQLQADNKYTYKLESSPTGYALIDFLQEGRIDCIIDSRDYESISLVFDVNLVANSKIKIYPLEVIPAE